MLPLLSILHYRTYSTTKLTTNFTTNSKADRYAKLSTYNTSNNATFFATIYTAQFSTR